MVESHNGVPPAERLPEELVERLDACSAQQLRAVREYAGELLSHMGPVTEAEVRADATGTVVNVARHDVYTLAWKQLPKEGETDEDSPTTSLYLVQREYTPDGERRLHWSYLGAVDEAGETICPECGTVVAPYASTCPRCGCEIEQQQEG